MTRLSPLLNLILRAVALAMTVASLVLLILGAAPLSTLLVLLGVGLLALSVSVLNRNPSEDGVEWKTLSE